MNNEFIQPIRRALTAECKSDIVGKYTTPQPAQTERATGCTRPAFKRLFLLGQAFNTGNAIVNATHLAQQFGVSVKTVHRDIGFLRNQLGLPIKYHGSQFNYSLS